METLTSAIQNIIEHLQDELRGIRSNRANPSMIEALPVQAYNSTMRLLEVASISAPEPQLLVVQPWDASLIPAIESAIRDDQKLQVSPVVDGQLIRVPLPSLTEERRLELVKLMSGIVEQTRVSIRKAREEALKGAKQQEKDGDISEDEYFRFEKEVQQKVDAANDEVKSLADAKEAELMTI